MPTDTFSESELSAVENLRGLGLGSLSTLVDAEVELAMCTPIDVARTAAALAKATPEQADAVVVSALAQNRRQRSGVVAA
ncbi:MAG: hypothetical protein ACRDQZ_01405 [Mycobacteriales bacterium]